MRIPATELTQVLINVLTNAVYAIAARGKPGGRVVLTAAARESSLVIEVRDDGIGMSSGLLPRVFDLFVQGRQASDRAEGGLGIGLALVRNLVTLHGGSVEARSPGLGKGSTFVVRLPALAVAPRAAAPAPTAFALLRSDAARRRVLIVDDNEDARMLLVDILEQAGHEVCAADSGPAAVRNVANAIGRSCKRGRTSMLYATRRNIVLGRRSVKIAPLTASLGTAPTVPSAPP